MSYPTPPEPMPADQAALRDRIAQALAAYDLPYFDRRHQYEVAAAVLAVLPATTDQTADTNAETPLEKRFRFSERRNDELRAENLRRGKRVLEQSEQILTLERQIDEVRGQLGAEILRAGQAEGEVDRLTAELADYDERCQQLTAEVANLRTMYNVADARTNDLIDERDQLLEARADRAAVIAEVLPAWEAVYEPGNVSDYLIGYANDQDAATGMAEAWMRSQAEVTGRLEWVDEQQMATGRYDRWFELVERHDDGVDTGPGIIVRRRMADETPAAETEAHEPLDQWRVEILDGGEWMPASRLHRDRAQAADQFQMSSERCPLWDDGTPVQRRLVRETTTCTVEQPAAGARQDEPDHVCNSVVARGHMDEPLGYFICGFCGTRKGEGQR